MSRSHRASEYRRWYKLTSWLGLRQRQLLTHPLCTFCLAAGQTTPATEVDHIVPHRGDRDLFFSADNLQSLCKPHHDGSKQREDLLGYSTAIGADGWPTDPRHPANAISVPETGE